ncbi:hypothetical protein DH2020_023823 [Rehmannia glutinosa]|uniref:Uncharacterized protein n=1 Tax=Rehmannia glutinosa TaxID=99300 RepID=A0ABR0WBH0_REHGL
MPRAACISTEASWTTGKGHDQWLEYDKQRAADVSKLPASDLPKLFQENFNELKRALAGADHSWTSHTLKLCSTLETTNKLVDSFDSQVASLSEKVKKLEQIVNRRDSAITAAKTI